MNGDGKTEGLAFRVSDIAVGDGEWLKINNKGGKQWYDSLLVRAELIAEHRLDLFGLKDKYLGDPIIWNHDYERGQDTPIIYCAS